MKLTCDRQKLLETFLIAESITPRKTSKPILKNIKLDALKNQVRIMATNMELTMKRTIEVGSVGKEGTVLVAGKDMVDILRETDSEDVFISVADNNVTIKAGEDTFTIPANIAEDFFSVEDIKPDFEVTITRVRLLEMIEQTLFTTGKETMAYTFEGILVNVEPKNMEIVGTDGKRIAIASSVCTNPSGREKKALVPIPTLRTLQHSLGISGDESITIKLCPNHIMFEDSRTQLVSQLIEGRFPEYRNYIPADYGISGSFRKAELEKGIRKADIMTSQETHLVKFGFSRETKSLTMTSRCLDRGTSEIRIPLLGYDGESVAVGYNGRHILDVLKVLREDKVTWRIKDDQGPGEIAEAGNFKYIFMPVKLR
ncbi:MAG: DNA polymerase III subunit beta [Planctomycetota bacterium]